MPHNEEAMMRILIAATTVATGGLIATGVLGVATAAETQTAPAAGSAAQRTVSVQGVADEPLSSEASAATATSAYRQAMAAAVSDGQAKAQFLAEKTSAALGPVQSVSEGGGYIECPGEIEYTGGQPDFGFATGGVVVAGEDVSSAPGRAVPVVGRAPVPKSKRKTKHHAKRGSARKSTAGTCTLSSQVALVYQLS
jgi:Protein of unknown function (DUF541)